MKEHGRKPTLEDVIELSGIDILHPGGLDITRRIGEVVVMRGKTVLDVACGRGTLPCYYAKNVGARVVGIDLSREMVDSSTKRAAEEKVEDLTEFKVADALALPFDDGQFDVVLNECAVGLTPDPQKCMDEMARVAKLGGYVVFHENTWLKDIPISEQKAVASAIGTVPLSLSGWKETMEKAGLTEPWTEDWSGSENMCKMRSDRQVKDPDHLFSLGEQLTIIFPRILSGFGIRGIVTVLQSSRKVTPLYSDGTLGYYLFRGRKP